MQKLSKQMVAAISIAVFVLILLFDAWLQYSGNPTISQTVIYYSKESIFVAASVGGLLAFLFAHFFS